MNERVDVETFSFAPPEHRRPLLQIDGLRLGAPQARAEALLGARSGVALEARAGEVLAVLGGVGSGKTLLGAALFGHLPEGVRVLAGEVRRAPEVLAQEARITLLPQHPKGRLDPDRRVRAQIGALLAQHRGLSGRAADEEAARILASLGMIDPPALMERRPRDLPLTLQQCVLIAMAWAIRPSLAILDEPFAVLEPSVRLQLEARIAHLRDVRGTGFVLLTRDVGVVRRLADRVALLDDGEIVEFATREAFFANPGHPAARRLISAQPGFARRGQWLGSDVARAPGKLRTGPQRLLVTDLRVAPEAVQGNAAVFVDGVDLALDAERTVVLLGDAGEGGGLVGRALAGHADASFGECFIDGEPLADALAQRFNDTRRAVQMLFSAPGAALDPLQRVGALVTEGMRSLGLVSGDEACRARCAALLHRVGLDPAVMSEYSVNLSVLDRQRVQLARLLAVDPRVLVVEWPGEGMTAPERASLLDLLSALRDERGLAMLVVSADAALAAWLGDEVAVMLAGRVVEQGPVEAVLKTPAHPYTQALIEAASEQPTRPPEGRAILRGHPAESVFTSAGCPLQRRCPKATEICARGYPAINRFAQSTHTVRCHWPG